MQYHYKSVFNREMFGQVSMCNNILILNLYYQLGIHGVNFCHHVYALRSKQVASLKVYDSLYCILGQ